MRDNDKEPDCNISGECEPLDGEASAATTSMCEHCGAMMVRLLGAFVRWDHPDVSW